MKQPQTPEQFMHVLRLIVQAGVQQGSTKVEMMETTFRIAEEFGIPDTFLLIDESGLKEAINNHNLNSKNDE